MDVLRTAVSMLGLFDPGAAKLAEDANRRRAAKLVAQIATIVTSFDRFETAKISLRAIRIWDMPQISYIRLPANAPTT